MSPIQSLRTRLRGRLRGYASRTVGWARENRQLRRVIRPAVSVIVPFYNVEEYFEECLESIAAQNFRDFEALLVDDGSLDGSLAIAQRFVERDGRFRIIRRPNGGLGAARNTGIRAARGKYLTFVDSDDALPVGALWALISSARRSGSDIVVGSVRRFDRTRAWRPAWVSRVHTGIRRGITLPEHLTLLRNLYTWNKLFRRDFFLEQGLWFREGVAYEDQPIISQLYNRARSIDLLTEVVYHYRNREDKTSISQQTNTMPDLLARIEAFHLTRDALKAEASQEIYDAWLLTLFDSHLHWYLRSRGISDDEFWKTIRATVLEFTEGAPAEVWRRTPPIYRVMLELARQDRREDLQVLATLEKEPRDNTPARPTAEGVLVELPGFGDPALPDELFLQHPDQLVLWHALESMTWETRDGEPVCRLTGWAYIKRIDLATYDSSVQVVLRRQRDGHELVVDSIGRPPGIWPANEVSWCDYSAGTFAVEIPVAELFERPDRRDTWTLGVRVSACGFTVDGPITHLVRSGNLGSLHGVRLGDGRRVVPQGSVFEPLRLRALPASVEVEQVSVEGRTVSGRLAGPDAGQVASVEARCGQVSVTAKVRGAAFSLALPPAPRLQEGAPATWSIVGRYVDNRFAALVVPDPAAGVGEGWEIVPDADLELTLAEHRLTAQAVSVLVERERLVVEGRVHGRLPEGAEIWLSSRHKKGATRGPEVVATGGVFRAELPLRRPVHRFGDRPLPHGEHELFLSVRAGAEVHELPMRIGTPLADRLPVPLDTPDHEGLLIRDPEASLRLALVRPVRGDRGPYRQRLLQEQPVTTRTRGILFRSYFGEKATDNGLSIQQELRRRGSDLPVYWAVHDHAVVVPEDGIPVVVNTAEWYELINSVDYYVDNMYQPTYHRKPGHQVLVQTFHGYPFKQMGLPHWRNMDLPEDRIRSYAERSAQWDYLVSPATYATPLLTRDFGYDGPVLEIGYPRNDVLLSPEAPAIRAAVRDSLGIREDQIAVLYAPTFRDYLSPDDMRAAMVDFFDFAEAHRMLGDRYVFLVRGHAFNARTRGRTDLPGTIEVTDYPEVSDLYLAADAGVVDYSSLRFDFGVTGKPMVFHVPDLARYHDTRGWLFDFEPTAPGPLLDTTAEVAEALADLPGLVERHREEYAAFRAAYLDLEDGHAGQRFVDRVIVPRGDA